MSNLAQNGTWASALRNQKAKVIIHYKISEPFLYHKEKHGLSGFEHEMLKGFKAYVKSKYSVNLTYHWEEHQGLRDIFKEIELDERKNAFGINNISWSKERQRRLKFSSAYFPDIQVLITHRNNPPSGSLSDFKTHYNKSSAITVKGTTYETSLFKIKKKYGLNFNIYHVKSSDELIKEILQSKNAFGYTDITSYLLALEENSPIKRINLQPVVSRGIGLIFNKKTDWDIPVNEYLASPEFEKLKTKLIGTYLGSDFEDFIEKLANSKDKEFVMLLQEKKFMDIELTKKDQQVAIQSHIRNILIAAVVSVLIIVYFLYNRNRIKTNANEVLMLHRKMIESQNRLLSKRNKELIEVNEEKNNFIHILSHDLRAPINNITGLSKLLLMEAEGKLDSDQINMIEHISSESRRLNKMVTRILDIEKIESKKIDEYRKVDLYQVVERVIKNYETQAKSKGIEMKSRLEKELYALGLDQYFFHVFENLVSNALKFSPIGESVAIELIKSEKGIEVKVIDNGPGMSEEDREKMFKKFQVLTAKATAGERSTGLGLSIVNKYIKLLNGQLICDSELGKGTTFTAIFHEFKEEGEIQ
ncbi:ATP-binding protein [Reichenbachiella versicolor]|uniref:ATP-binding protein n=1 Tax=Reichenbachiella versicolor TaxID=1821036 RepID=UPI000D6E7579|nr:ATP-binding protein [Reichenbachiella versicolor]